MKFDILGIGNALVDVSNSVSIDFIDKISLPFNQFKQLTFQEQEEIIKQINPSQGPEIICGGSTTNSLVAASNYGSLCGHICQLGDDERGVLYINDLKENGIVPVNNFFHSKYNTGRCLVFITPGGERTMGTYLGASEFLKFDNSFIEYANNAKVVFSEGYQFTSDTNFDSFLSILENVNENVRFALSLSDPFVVEAFRDRFDQIIKLKKIDYLFCNREEAKALGGENYLDSLKDISNNFAVTNGGEPSEVFSENNLQYIKAFKVKAHDSNGAGDMYAGSVLHKVLKEGNFFEACKFGNYASSIIVQKDGPRLSKKMYKEILDNYPNSL